jgi:hypothetical protein
MESLTRRGVGLAAWGRRWPVRAVEAFPSKVALPDVRVFQTTIGLAMLASTSDSPTKNRNMDLHL